MSENPRTHSQSPALPLKNNKDLYALFESKADSQKIMISGDSSLLKKNQAPKYRNNYYSNQNTSSNSNKDLTNQNLVVSNPKKPQPKLPKQIVLAEQIPNQLDGAFKREKSRGKSPITNKQNDQNCLSRHTKRENIDSLILSTNKKKIRNIISGYTNFNPNSNVNSDSEANTRENYLAKQDQGSRSGKLIVNFDKSTLSIKKKNSLHKKSSSMKSDVLQAYLSKANWSLNQYSDDSFLTQGRQKKFISMSSERNNKSGYGDSRFSGNKLEGNGTNGTNQTTCVFPVSSKKFKNNENGPPIINSCEIRKNLNEKIAQKYKNSNILKKNHSIMNSSDFSKTERANSTSLVNERSSSNLLNKDSL